MDKVESSIGMTSLAVTTAMAGVLLTGCASNSAPLASISATSAEQALADGRADRAIGHAEVAVQTQPRNAAHRAMLAKAYLDAGRFASAETSYGDAMTLGDNSPRTALSLALALTAQAKYTQAGALLNEWETQIATADLGLALALVGQPERGIHLMSNAIRGGESSVKIRQNLAFAFAVAGRWREARMMVAQDVPADQVGARMSHWAELSSPLAYEHRVAGLLGVPTGVQDAGLPVQLALANTPSIDQLASEANAFASVEAPEAQPAAIAAAPVLTSSGELPALEQDREQMAEVEVAPVEVAIAAQTEPDLPTLEPMSAAPVPIVLASLDTISVPASSGELPAVGSSITAESSTVSAKTFSTENLGEDAPEMVSQERIVFYSAPVVQALPTAYLAAAEAAGTQLVQNAEPVSVAHVETADTVEELASVSSPVTSSLATSSLATSNSAEAIAIAPVSDDVTAGSDHLVQLGSFLSEQNAQNAASIYTDRYPDLAGHNMVITEAMVSGKRYFRVSADGFDDNASRAMCSRINTRGNNACVSWAASSPLPGNIGNSARRSGISLAMR